jgi:hypothetical protein
LGSSANVADLNEEVSCAMISFIKGTALRRTLLKIGRIGKSRNTEKFRAFAGFQV